MLQETNIHQQFQKTMELHKGILFKVARTYCRNESDRHDLTQEMMIQIWKSWPKYDHRFAITTWLYRITLNVAISFYRKYKMRQGNHVPIEDITPVSQDYGTDEKERHLNLLDRFINELNDLDKALVLLYLDDKTHAETGEILGMSTTNVSTKLARIKDKLKIKFSQFNN